MERFERFWFSVPAVPLQKRFFCVSQYSLTGKDGSGSGCGLWQTVLAVPVPVAVSGKTVPTVPVSGSGSVPEPPCNTGNAFEELFARYFGKFLGEVMSVRIHDRAILQYYRFDTPYRVIFLK